MTREQIIDGYKVNVYDEIVDDDLFEGQNWSIIYWWNAYQSGDAEFAGSIVTTFLVDDNERELFDLPKEITRAALFFTERGRPILRYLSEQSARDIERFL